MSQNNSILENFDVLNKINEEIKRDIKLLYVFKAYSEDINVILVTNEDKVFCFGRNWNGVLGFGHDDNIKQFTINEDLCQKQIIDFKNSQCHTIARTRSGKVYCWGSNNWGSIGNGRAVIEISKPILNKYLIDENIIDLSCGYRHTLVLTSNNEVYAWGDNDKGQIGNRSNGNVVSKPYKVNELNREKVKEISCGFKHSMALTDSGKVFCWGYNNCGQLSLNYETLSFRDKAIYFGLFALMEGVAAVTSFSPGATATAGSFSEKCIVFAPKLIQIEVKIKKISCGHSHSLLLSSEGDIYMFGSNENKQLGLMKLITNEKQLTPINRSEKFVDIASYYKYNISAALSENGLYYAWGECGKDIIREPNETKFKSFDELFSSFCGITHKTIIFPRYRTEFIEKELLGEGNFGKVYKVFYSIEQQYYAIKKINIKGLPSNKKAIFLEELQFMQRLKSDYVVCYKRSWIEDDNIFYIQMELCYKSMNYVIEQMRSELNRKQSETMSAIEYYISSELFNETVEALNYLHKQKPPIIHRDLKTENILITYGVNGRFIKLVDFGLSVIHEFKNQSQSKDKGMLKYAAPEVLKRRHDTKGDIYSLGFVTQQLFDIDIYDFTNDTIDNPLLKNRYRIISEFILDMMSPIKYKRPDCEHLLKNKILWYLDLNVIKGDLNQQQFNELSISEQSIEKSFFKFFIKTKLMYK